MIRGDAVPAKEPKTRDITAMMTGNLDDYPVVFFLFFGLACSLAGAPKDPVDYVDPYIGSIGHLLTATSPNVHLPHAMLTAAPVTTPGIQDRYLADKIYGFQAGGNTLMPTAGPLETATANAASPFDHDLETVTPYYYSVKLLKYGIDAEYTVSERSVYYRFAFPENTPRHLLWTVRENPN